MKLLETTPQDIKVKHDFKPCAPASFRWIVAGAYILLILAGVFYVGVDLWDRRMMATSQAEKRKLDNINAEVASVRSQGEQTARLRDQYNQTQVWLRNNYSLAGILSSLFGALPESARIQEMDLANVNGTSQFALKLRLFHTAGMPTPGFAPMEEKLQTAGFLLTDPEVPAEGVTDVDYSILLTAPAQFFPNGRPQASAVTAPRKAIQ